MPAATGSMVWLDGWTSPLASCLHKLIAEKSDSLTPSDADVLPCKTPTPGANAHSGIRSAGASGSLLASSAVMTVRLATGSFGYTRGAEFWLIESTGEICPGEVIGELPADTARLRCPGCAVPGLRGLRGPLGLSSRFGSAPEMGVCVAVFGDAVSVGQAYIEIGMAWYRASSRGWYSLNLVSSGEKMAHGGEEASAHDDRDARWFLPVSVSHIHVHRLDGSRGHDRLDIRNDNDPRRRSTGLGDVAEDCLCRERVESPVRY